MQLTDKLIPQVASTNQKKMMELVALIWERVLFLEANRQNGASCHFWPIWDTELVLSVPCNTIAPEL